MAAPTEDQIAPIARRLALLFALSVLIVLPSGYFVLKYSSLIQQLETIAEVKAAALDKLATAAPNLWTYQLQRMEELLVRNPVVLGGNRITVRDVSGNALLTVGDVPDAPVLFRSAPIYDFGEVVGHVEIMHSYRTVVFGTLVAMLLGLLFGGLAYAAGYALPLRALRGVTSALVRETAARNAAMARARAVAQTANDAFIIADGAGLIVGWNPAAERLFGYTEAEAIGQPLTLMMPPRYRNGHVDGMRKILAGGERNVIGRSVEVHGLTKAGSEFPLELSLSAWETPEGMFFAGIIHDITARKLTEETLRERDSRYRTVVETSSDGFWVVDQEGRLLDVNDAYARRSGYTREELLGMRVSDLEAKESVAEISAHLDIIQSKGADIFETLHRAKDGATWPVEVSVKQRSDRPGQILCFLRDITERKRAEHAIKQLNRSNELLLASVGQGIYGVDVEGNATFINPAAEKLLGWRAEELIGKPVHRIFHHTKPDGSPYPREECPVYKAFRDGKVHRINEEVFWRKDGTSFPVEYTSTPILDEDNALIGAVAVFNDITERKRVEDELKRYAQSLAKVMSQLTMAEEHERRAIAADLHDDLTQLLAVANIRMRSLPNPDNSAGYGKVIREITEVVEQAERSARSLSFQLSPSMLFELGLVPALEGLAEELRKVYRLTAIVHDDGEPKDLTPTARSVLYRATRELLINVAKHAKVEVANVDVRCEEGLVMISVTDSGVGFDKQLSEKHAANAGFGLASMRERLGLIGGSFDIDTHPGDGTVATLTAPLPTAVDR